MQIIVKAVGTKPFTPANVDAANPRSPWYRKMAELRGVRSNRRTDKWLDDMEYAMFMSCFYDIPDVDGIAIPAENMRQSLIEAAKMTRQGAQATKAIMVTVPAVPLIFEGPRKPQELWDDGHYKLTRMIRGSSNTASPTTWPSKWCCWTRDVLLESGEVRRGASFLHSASIGTKIPKRTQGGRAGATPPARRNAATLASRRIEANCPAPRR